jgi:hypothetical protein
MSSTKANSTSFKPVSRIRTLCKECAVVFEKREKERKIFCSVACSNTFTRRKRFISQSKEDVCLELAKEGKTIIEISKITGFPQGSISSYLNKAKFRKSTQGQSYAAKNNRLKKIYNSCVICNFDRIVEVCHIIPASEEGELSESNTIGLCPNHHHLFDNKQLTLEEAEKLSYKVPNYKDYVKKIEVKKHNIILGVSVQDEQVSFNEQRKFLKENGYDPSTVDRVLKGTLKTAYKNKWYKYKLFTPEVQK